MPQFYVIQSYVNPSVLRISVPSVFYFDKLMLNLIY